MTEQRDLEDFESEVRRRTRSWGPHTIRLGGPLVSRVAMCSCGGWESPVGSRDAGTVAEEYDDHVAAAQGRRRNDDERSLSAARASSSLQTLFVAGLLLVVVCGALAVILFPHAFADDVATDFEEDRSNHMAAMLGFILTALLAWGGQVMVLVACIGWGVRLGNEATRRPEA